MKMSHEDVDEDDGDVINQTVTQQESSCFMVQSQMSHPILSDSYLSDGEQQQMCSMCR